jgi:hypothetical protein
VLGFEHLTLEVRMNVALWTGQIAAAALFLYSAVTKGTWSKEHLLAKGQTGVGPVPLPLLRFVAFTELLGAIGLIGPWATGVARVLTPLAAIGLAVIMLGAGAVHLSLREPRTALANLAILGVCALVAAGRLAELV